MAAIAAIFLWYPRFGIPALPGATSVLAAGSHPPNARCLHDMAGNEWRFTSDPWLGSYAEMSANPAAREESATASNLVFNECCGDNRLLAAGMFGEFNFGPGGLHE